MAATKRTSLDLPRAADTLEGLVLEHAEQLGLERGPDVADLVEEHRPAVRDLELAALLLVGPGERALLVAEQLGLEKLLGQGHAVDHDERLVSAVGSTGGSRER